MAHRYPRPLSRRDFLQYATALAGAASVPAWLSACAPDTVIDLGGDSLAPWTGGDHERGDPVGGDVVLTDPQGLIDWPMITPNDGFFRTDSGAPAEIDADTWQLTVSGMVDTPETLTLADLQALPMIEVPATLLTISNRVGGGAIGTARWKGVSFAELLPRWGVQDGVYDMVIRDVGTYTDSIPISYLQDHFAMLAWEMNGEPLPHLHGAPVRVIVPGIYGMKNVKWVGGLQFVSVDHLGFWQQGGWSDSALVRPLAQIRNIPRGYRMAPGVLPVNGVAWAGDRGISGVEVSADGGDHWTPASFEQPLGPHAWARWETAFVMDSPGTYDFLVRMYDGSGVQQQQTVDSYLEGSEGWHWVPVVVTPS